MSVYCSYGVWGMGLWGYEEVWVINELKSISVYNSRYDMQEGGLIIALPLFSSSINLTSHLTKPTLVALIWFYQLS
jgi:hypothetical protein